MRCFYVHIMYHVCMCTYAYVCVCVCVCMCIRMCMCICRYPVRTYFPPPLQEEMLFRSFGLQKPLCLQAVMQHVMLKGMAAENNPWLDIARAVLTLHDHSDCTTLDQCRLTWLAELRQQTAQDEGLRSCFICTDLLWPDQPRERPPHAGSSVGTAACEFHTVCLREWRIIGAGVQCPACGENWADASSCLYCTEETRDLLYYEPCWHASYCEVCTPQALQHSTSCPMCRSQPTRVAGRAILQPRRMAVPDHIQNELPSHFLEQDL